jgi:uncharacterized protein YbjT (DUF2867 family)
MSTTSKTQILLLGAGELGTALFNPLSTLPNTHITIGVRTPSKYAHLSSPTVHLTEINLTDDSQNLAKTFSHFDILISATGFGADPSSVLKLAHEVLSAGQIRKASGKDKLWFFPWQWGVDYDVTRDGQGLMPLFGAQRDVRNILREKAEDSNVRWTVVSTGIFMSFLFEQFWGVVERRDSQITVRCLRGWEHKVTVTDVGDIGRVLARVVASTDGVMENVVYVAGDTVSYGELADVVERVSGEVVKREAWGMEYLKEELRKNPDDGIKKYRLVFAREGVWWDKKRTMNAKLGMHMVDVESFAKKLFDKTTE